MDLRKNQREMSVHFSSKKHDRGTPWDFFDVVNEEFELDLDVCANDFNAKLPRFISPEQDAFKVDWNGRCWMNPPYGREIGKWMERAFRQAAYNPRCEIICCLVPSRTDTVWWHQWVMQRAYQVRFIKGRLVFDEEPASAPFPSALVIYRNMYAITKYMGWDWKKSPA